MKIAATHGRSPARRRDGATGAFCGADLRRRGAGAGLAQAIAIERAQEMDPIETGRGGGGGDISTVPAQDGNEVVALEALDEPRLRRLERDVERHFARGGFFGRNFVRTKGQYRLDCISKLADVSRPRSEL